MDASEPTRAPTSDAATISRGIVQLIRATAGRGPTKARTTIGRDHVLVMLEETLTQAEATLVESGHEEKVLSARQVLQQAMRPGAVRLIEGTLRREVRAFLSANSIDPDVAAEIFLLAPLADGAVAGPPHEADAD
jgi:uncharacterized protein YbcI